MKTKAIQKTMVPGIEYPVLMVVTSGTGNDGAVVLFAKRGEGTVVHGEGAHKVGHHSDGWAMGCFSKYNGKIELSSDD